MIIVDNCINIHLADEIEQIFLDPYTYWWYDPCTAGRITYDADKFLETSQFVHPIMDNGRADSPYTSLVIKAVDSILTAHSRGILNYRRVKINQLLKYNSNDSVPHPPHKDDVADNIISMIYYIHDSDGPTYFFDENYQIVDKIVPKKNRCVIFPSNQLHSSSSPIINERRLVINAVASTDYKL